MDSLRALIVEDDLNFLQLVELRLRAWRPSIDLVHANSIARASVLLDNPQSKFRLVILDQHLPDGLGSQLFEHQALNDAAVLAVSSDPAPELPGQAVRAGAQHFLEKRQVSEPLFIPLIEALLERKRLERELLEARFKQYRMQAIKMLLATLRHEINNPLGAVLGATFLIRSLGTLGKEQSEAVRVVEASGNRIKHVLQQLCDAVELEQVNKGHENLFQVPGDLPWLNTAALDAKPHEGHATGTSAQDPDQTKIIDRDLLQEAVKPSPENKT